MDDTTPEPDTSPLVLLVEDDDDSREMYAMSLERSRFRVAEASDSGDALQKARTLTPDAIVTDLVLKGLGGLDLLTILKSDIPTKYIPVIVLTGHSRDEHEQQAVGAGCDLFLTKPCDPDALVAAIRHVLERSSSS